MKNELNCVNQKIIDAVIEQAKIKCLNSLALIGIYGSVATGDEYAKSDLDLLILIEDDEGWKLGTGFILEDSKVGYDIYCTNWEGLLWDAECHHAQLAKLMDSKIVYVNHQEALEKLTRLREQTKEFLQSGKRFERVDELIEKAKVSYADACLREELGKVRVSAADAILYLLDAIMIFHGSYFRRGVKRVFLELSQFPLDADFLDNMQKIARSKDVTELRNLVKALVLYAESYVSREKELEEPSKDSISGTYEEMYSNWRNKVEEAAAAGDAFSSFMNMCSLQCMVSDIASDVGIGTYDIMGAYDPDCLEANVEIYDQFLEQYEKVYEKAGLQVNRYQNVDEFGRKYIS